MEFSNTTNKDGIIQTIEFWTRLPDGEISGTSILLKQITGRVNRAFDKIMPSLLSYSDYIRWDDINHADRPIGTVDITSGQSDYTITEDDNSLDILNLTRVRIYSSSSATDYIELKRMNIDDDRALEAMSPNSSGTPSHFLEKGNTIFLYPEPNYSSTDGLQLFFEREQHYFESGDTTDEPGIPKPFHELLALFPSYDYVLVHRPDDTNTLTAINNRIFGIENDLEDMISKRNPTRSRLTISNDSNK